MNVRALNEVVCEGVTYTRLGSSRFWKSIEGEQLTTSQVQEIVNDCLRSGIQVTIVR
jgi:hypothetical protein